MNNNETKAYCNFHTDNGDNIGFVGCQKPEETLETDRIETSTIEETTSQALQVPLEPKEGVPLSNLGKVAVRSIYTEPFEMHVFGNLKYEFENSVLDRQKLAKNARLWLRTSTNG